MNIFKKVLTYLFFALIALIIAAIILPFVYKDKVYAYLKENINNGINAKVDFADVDISFLSSFPDVKLSLDSLSVIGIEEFEDIVLYKAETTSIDINLRSLIGKDNIPEINEINLIRPEINILVLKDSTANYLISKDTSASSNFALVLENYSIEDGTISYQDNTMPMIMKMEHIYHNGSGSFTQDVFDIKTKTDIGNIKVKYAGTQYVDHMKAKITANINANMLENKFTLKDNIIRLNDLDLSGEGSVEMKGDDIITDISFVSDSQDFKSFLSIIPGAYTSDFKDVQAKGKASINGIIKGTYNGIKGQMPGFEIGVKINDAMFKYPGLPKSMTDIFADIKVKAQRSDYKDMSIQIPSFECKVGSDELKGKLMAQNLTGDQAVEGMLVAKVDLANIKEVIPMEDVQELKGLLNSNLDFKAKMSDVNAQNYTAIQFNGGATLQNMTYKSKDMPKITIPSATASATPKQISITAEGIEAGASNLNGKINIENPLAAFSASKGMALLVDANSTYFDMDEWQSTTPAPNTSAEIAPVPLDEELIKNSTANIHLKTDKLIVNQMSIDNLELQGKLAANAIDITKMSGNIENSDFSVTGIVSNGYDYMFNNGVLDGKILFASNKFNANTFMTEDTDAVSDTLSIIPVPERVKLNITTFIKNLTYTNMELKDFQGVMEVENKEIALRDMQTNTLGGIIKMEGLYNTQQLNSPDFSMKVDLSKIKFSEAASKLETLKKIAPIIAYIDGVFNTTLVMKGKLGSQMTPELSTLDASGFMETLTGALKGFGPLEKLSQKLGINELKEVNLANTKNWFEVVQGFVEFKDYSNKLKDIDYTIGGKHGFDQSMDYNIALSIPREKLKNNKVTSSIESGLSFIEKEASKLGVNIDQGPTIFMDVNITGNITDPVFKIRPKQNAGATIQDAIQDKVDESVAMLKDTVRKEIAKKQEELRDTVTKRVNQEMDKAKAKAETAVNKAADSIKAKAKEVVINKLDTITKGVISDTLKKQATDILDKATGGEVDKIKDKIKDFNPFKKKPKGN